MNLIRFVSFFFLIFSFTCRSSLAGFQFQKEGAHWIVRDLQTSAVPLSLDEPGEALEGGPSQVGFGLQPLQRLQLLIERSTQLLSERQQKIERQAEEGVCQEKACTSKAILLCDQILSDLENAILSEEERVIKKEAQRLELETKELLSSFKKKDLHRRWMKNNKKLLILSEIPEILNEFLNVLDQFYSAGLTLRFCEYSPLYSNFSAYSKPQFVQSLDSIKIKNPFRFEWVTQKNLRLDLYTLSSYSCSDSTLLASLGLDPALLKEKLADLSSFFSLLESLCPSMISNVSDRSDLNDELLLQVKQPALRKELMKQLLRVQQNFEKDIQFFELLDQIQILLIEILRDFQEYKKEQGAPASSHSQ